MKISIVTPTFKRPSFVENTIESVLLQKGDFDIEYIVQDGNSGAEISDILKRWEGKLNKGAIHIGCNSIDFRWFSESDTGMYDALNKGFSKTTGDVLAWINSDDYYHPGAFAAVSQIFNKYQDVQWITGIPNSFNKFGSTIGFDTIPHSYSRHYISRGLYTSKYFHYGLNWLPQDCIFWRASLWRETGAFLNTDLRFAADFELWQRFAEKTDLVKVNAFLGGYRFHGDQITANPTNYTDELPKNVKLPANFLFFYWLIRHIPGFRRLIFNKNKGFPILEVLSLRWEWLVGRVVAWDHASQEWRMYLREIT